MRSSLLASLFALSCLFTVGAADAANLTVKVAGISKASGTLMVQLMDSEAAWNGKAKPVSGARQAIVTTDPVELSFKDLPAGRYAIRLMHDENDNGKLDSNLLGMPTEGYGYSNNPRVMRAAKFDEAAFDVGDADSAISIELN